MICEQTTKGLDTSFLHTNTFFSALTVNTDNIDLYYKQKKVCGSGNVSLSCLAQQFRSHCIKKGSDASALKFRLFKMLAGITSYVGHMATVHRSMELCQTELKSTKMQHYHMTKIHKVLTLFPFSGGMLGMGRSLTGSVAAFLSEPAVMKHISGSQ